MIKYIFTVFTGFLFTCLSPVLQAQQFEGTGGLSGNIEMNFQTYSPDSEIGADSVREKIGFQSYANLIYNHKNLEAGLRYEIYSPPLAGINSGYKGSGIANRYLTYRHELLEITAGHFYEQFGSGLTLRSYQEWALGYDNAIDGVRIRLNPVNGIRLTGLAGHHRNFWSSSPGTIRGIDGEIIINQLLAFLKEKKTLITLGGSFVSRFQKDKSILYKIPENVGIYSARAEIMHGGIRFSGEYASKINDPSAINNFIYKPGEALFLEGMYTQRGLGATITAKRIDNMSFKSDYNATGIPLEINYLPPLSIQHTYELANVYPYATQPNGEMGIQASLYYMFKRNSTLGGKYGSRITLDYSRIHDIDKKAPSDTTEIGESGTLGYESPFFGLNEFTFFEELSLGIEKKISSDWKVILNYLTLTYDPLIKGDEGLEKVHADIGIASIYYSVKRGQSLKMELQWLTSDQEELHEKDYSAGDWGMLLLEYNLNNYFFAVKDLYNYRNPSPGINDIHYFNAAAGFSKGPNRLAISYGRQRQGISCVGGVCRPEPAANGLNITITSNF
ncbi:MAG: DUF6029 family protein [Bacteroidales bacterium]